MKREVGLWQFSGFVLAAALGTILHFLYDWTGNVGVAAFSAVNESTWEHMKLVFFPSFLFAIVQSKFFYKEYKGFWWVKLVGILLATLLVPVLFYTFNGAFGQSPDWLNILFFFMALGVAYFVEWVLLRRGGIDWKAQGVAVAILCAVAVLFVLFTFVTPQLPLFEDPISGKYGL